MNRYRVGQIVRVEEKRYDALPACMKISGKNEFIIYRLLEGRTLNTQILTLHNDELVGKYTYWVRESDLIPKLNSTKLYKQLLNDTIET